MNCDTVAARFDHRYQRFEYRGIRESLHRFLDAPGLRILEVGCGTGHWLGEIVARGHWPIGVDYSRGMLEQAAVKKIGAPLIRADAQALPFAAQSFDRIVLVHALHHFPDPAGFFREAWRLLKPGGGLITFDLDPFDPENVWYVYEYFASTLEIDRRRYPSTDCIRREMTEAGLGAIRTFEADRFQGSVEAEEAFAQGMLERWFTSQLAELPEDDYAAGVGAVRNAITNAAPGELHLRTDMADYATLGWRLEPAQVLQGEAS